MAFSETVFVDTIDEFNPPGLSIEAAVFFTDCDVRAKPLLTFCFYSGLQNRLPEIGNMSWIKKKNPLYCFTIWMKWVHTTGYVVNQIGCPLATMENQRWVIECHSGLK